MGGIDPKGGPWALGICCQFIRVDEKEYLSFPLAESSGEAGIDLKFALCGFE